MNKKERRFIKRSFLKVQEAFSLVELCISLLVIAIIIAALTPVVSKRLTSSSSIKNRISTSCDSLYPDGYCAMCYITPKSCITCTRSCEDDEFKNVSNCACEKCAEKFNDNNCSKCNSKRCTQCNEGYYLEGNKCAQCPAGYYCYQQKDTSVKEACPKGYYSANKGQNVCDKCAQSTSSQQGSIAPSVAMTSCTPCTNGFYAKNEGQGTACENCPAGYYCPEGTISPCPLGTANNKEKQTQCVSCTKSDATTKGTVGTTTAMTSCIPCTSGFYAKEKGQTSACAACSAGYYCPEGKIIPCPKGYYNKDERQTTCLPCLASSASVQGSVGTTTAMTSCILCASGKYASSSAQTSACTNCPAGYYCPDGKKIQCPKGYYCPQGSNSARECPQGYYSASQGASSCSICPAGYYSGTKATSCSQCGIGYYSSQGASSCSQCQSGKTSPQGSTSANACVSCKTGCSACQGTASNCTSCSNGYYKNAASCVTCPAGYYCKNNNKTICPEDNYCPQGASAPTACPAGSTSAQGSKSANDCENDFDCTFEYTNYSGTKKYLVTGTKAGNLCIMTRSDKTYYAQKADPTLNLTWTAVTESNIESLCTDPANQHFSVFAGSCTGATYSRQDINNKGGYKLTQYASSCRGKFLSCGVSTFWKCSVDRKPCSNSYYKNYYLTIFSDGINQYAQIGNTTTKMLITLYSQEIHNAAYSSNSIYRACSNTSVVSYYSTYYGGSATNSTCNADCCDQFLFGLQNPEYYIVKKQVNNFQ